MNEFRGVNYCTLYECRGDVSHSLRTDCCFHTVTKDDGDFYMSNHYEIVFFKGLEYLQTTYNNNSCFLTRSQIEYYMNMLKQFVSFEYALLDGEYTRDDFTDEDFCDNFGFCEDNDIESMKYFQLNITLAGNILQHKFLLKMVRALYEYPFNMEFLDLIRLTGIFRFQRYGLVNLYNFVTHSCYNVGVSCNDDQSLCDMSQRRFPIFTKTDDFIYKITHVSETDEDDWYDFSMNNVHPYRECDTSEIGQIRNNYSSLFGNERYNLEFWQSEEKFAERLKFYNAILKYYK